MTREEALAWLKARTLDDMPSILAGKPILINSHKGKQMSRNSIDKLYTAEEISHEIIEQKIRNEKNLENLAFLIAKKVQDAMILSEGKYAIRITDIVDEVLKTIPFNEHLHPLVYVKEAAEILKKTGLEIHIHDQSKMDRDFKMPEHYLYYCLSPQLSIDLARINAENP